MMFTPDTLALFWQMLDAQVLPANHPEFEQEAAKLSTARRELRAAIEQAVAGDDTDAPAA